MRNLPCPVLLVCDDALSRMAAADALARLGCAVVETADAEFALEVLHVRNDIRAVFTAANQLGMMTGYELVRIVERDRPDIRHLVVIGSEPPRPGQLPAGASFLERPLDPARMIDLLARPRTGGPSS